MHCTLNDNVVRGTPTNAREDDEDPPPHFARCGCEKGRCVRRGAKGSGDEGDEGSILCSMVNHLALSPPPQPRAASSMTVTATVAGTLLRKVTTMEKPELLALALWSADHDAPLWLVAHPALMAPTRFKRLRRYARVGSALELIASPPALTPFTRSLAAEARCVLTTRQGRDDVPELRQDEKVAEVLVVKEWREVAGGCYADELRARRQGDKQAVPELTPGFIVTELDDPLERRLQQQQRQQQRTPPPPPRARRERAPQRRPGVVVDDDVDDDGNGDLKNHTDLLHGTGRAVRGFLPTIIVHFERLDSAQFDPSFGDVNA